MTMPESLCESRVVLAWGPIDHYEKTSQSGLLKMKRSHSGPRLHGGTSRRVCCSTCPSRLSWRLSSAPAAYSLSSSLAACCAEQGSERRDCHSRWTRCPTVWTPAQGLSGHLWRTDEANGREAIILDAMVLDIQTKCLALTRCGRALRRDTRRGTTAGGPPRIAPAPFVLAYVAPSLRLALATATWWHDLLRHL